MAKNQYRFNPESVRFENQSNPSRKKILLTLGFIVTAMLTGFLTFWLFGELIGSPREQELLNENAALKANYEVMDKKLQNINAVLEDIQNRDDNLYRFLLNADPIPNELRNSGMGGINKYNKLDSLSNAEMVRTTAEDLDKMLKKTYVQSKSLDEIESLANLQKEMLTSVPAIMPIRKELLRTHPSGYGMRLHPIYGIYRMHKGMDFAAPSGTDIYATGDGVVTKVKRSKGYGIHVIIKHNYGGYETLYAHMIRAKAKVGQKVKRGDVIGYVGSTGDSTAPHVHYEVHKNGRVLNPINFYFNDLSPEEYEEIIHQSNNSVKSFD
ncbi:peptidase M23-like protein [Balneicella halophila]|uniref:Peptidase M23-like protein n=1 Tax=Balneicella halophila TaxID=1537566 RepID=A0A7L4UP89_BALHA|nr:peptidoglycan DD-metalloendopeptidase family protein [Balneicella halophila]PVX50953.1 peptidase M23-like protein [Balneicella halophila]